MAFAARGSPHTPCRGEGALSCESWEGALSCARTRARTRRSKTARNLRSCGRQRCGSSRSRRASFARVLSHHIILFRPRQLPPRRANLGGRGHRLAFFRLLPRGARRLSFSSDASSSPPTPHRALTLAIATATDLRAGGRASDRARRSPRPEELVVHRARAERSLVAELQTAMVQPVKPRAETRYLYPRGGADAARGVQEVGQSLGRHREGLAGSDGQRGEESPQL